jgi:hypothetical protein
MSISQRFAELHVSRWPQTKLAVPHFFVQPVCRREPDRNTAHGGEAR